MSHSTFRITEPSSQPDIGDNLSSAVAVRGQDVIVVATYNLNHDVQNIKHLNRIHQMDNQMSMVYVGPRKLARLLWKHVENIEMQKQIHGVIAPTVCKRFLSGIIRCPVINTSRFYEDCACLIVGYDKYGAHLARTSPIGIDVFAFYAAIGFFANRLDEFLKNHYDLNTIITETDVVQLAVKSLYSVDYTDPSKFNVAVVARNEPIKILLDDVVTDIIQTL